MSNWYKIAWNHGIPLSENYKDKDVRNTESLTKPAWWAGGEQREGYPQGTSAFETKEDYGPVKQLPGEAVIMDDAPGEMADTQLENTLEKFTDPIDKLKSFDIVEPKGPHNMPHGDVYTELKQKSRVKGIKKT